MNSAVASASRTAQQALHRDEYPRRLRLHPDDPDDPRVFRAEFPEYGMGLHVAFSEKPATGAGTTRLLLDMSFGKRAEFRNPDGGRQPGLGSWQTKKGGEVGLC